MPLGIYINTVYENSPAEEAGLAKGNIITAFDGQTVKSMSELKSLLAYYRFGETVDLTIMVQSADGYTEKTVSITLGAKDSIDDSSESQRQETPQQDEDPRQYYNPFSFWSIP